MFRAGEMPWTVDNGCKWLLAAEGENGLRTSLPYPGRPLDPELRFAPISRPFAQPIGGRLVSQYPLTFSLLSRPFLRLPGAWGRYLLPILGALLAAWGAGRLAEHWTHEAESASPGHRSREAGSTGSGSGTVAASALLWGWLFAGPLGPLAWYGTTFWEHTSVAACVVWGTLFWARAIGGSTKQDEGGRRGGRRSYLGLRAYPYVSGLLLAFGTWMREETAAVFLVLVTCTFLVRPRPRAGRWFALLGSYGAGLVPLLLWQRWVTGSLLGTHFRENVSGSLFNVLISDRLSVIRGLLWSGDEGATEAGDLVLTLLTAILALAVARVSSQRLRSWGVGAVSALAGSIALVCIFALQRETDMPMTLIRTAGLFFFAPWIVWCCSVRGVSLPRLAWSGPLAVVVFLQVTPAVTAFGFHWGPRVLLSALPLIAAVAALGFARMQARSSGLVPPLGATFLVLSCFSLQAYGGVIQGRVTRGAEDYLERTHHVVAPYEAAPLVTHLWWYAPTFTPLLLERPVYKVRSKPELEAWIRRFGAAGGRRFYWATAAPTDEILKGLPVRITGSETMDGYPKAYRHRLLEVVLEEGAGR